MRVNSISYFLLLLMSLLVSEAHTNEFTCFQSAAYAAV